MKQKNHIHRLTRTLTITCLFNLADSFIQSDVQ
uniref:Uncharacterized protein n=1 Tax=Anguilla anguilla TaxID=7936 RepID=A0A0E9SFV4_ANGAN